MHASKVASSSEVSDFNYVDLSTFSVSCASYDSGHIILSKRTEEVDLVKDGRVKCGFEPWTRSSLIVAHHDDRDYKYDQSS